MFVQVPGLLVVNAASPFRIAVVLLICCMGVAWVRLPMLVFWLHSSIIALFAFMWLYFRNHSLCPPFSCLQASQDCSNFEFMYDLVKVAGYDESLLVHIRPARNSSSMESGNVVDFSTCSVTLHGSTGRSFGRFASHHTGAGSYSAFCSTFPPTPSSIVFVIFSFAFI
jgi:hypothetical protein